MHACKIIKTGKDTEETDGQTEEEAACDQK
jgi:hypothetical protein